MASRHYNDPTYRANRKAILEHNPYCAWCKTRKATTADHIIEVDRGGDHSLGNLVPACQRCNSSRGASYVNAKTNARVKARQAASKAATPARQTASPVFGAGGSDPGRSSSKNIPKAGQKRPRRPASVAVVPDEDGSTPRLQTPIRGVRTHGPDVCRWIETHMGLTPMPWQRTALAGQLEYETPGFPLFRTSLVSVARQNGKSVCLAGLLGWWLTEGAALRKQPQTVVSTAHTLDLAVSLFQTMAPLLEARFGGEPKWSFGRNQLTMPDGSVWLVRAATGSAGHGRSIDLVLIDEAWDINADVIDQGLLPAQRARKNPLCSMWSTAGTEASIAMLRFRSQGLAAIDADSPGSHYMAEWSVPENVDPADSTFWRMANPAIGHTLDLEVLEAESAGPNQSAFLRASLNMWVSTDKAWLDPGVWERCTITGPYGAPAVLAIDSSQDGQRFVGVTAHPTADGQLVLRVAFSVSTESELWRNVEQVMTVPACQLAVTPALQIHVPPGLARRSTTVGYAELTKWTTLVKSMILDGRVGHVGQLTLTEHMARAVAVKTNSGWTLSSQKSPGPIELARCAIWAAALATKPKWTARPAMAAGRS